MTVRIASRRVCVDTSEEEGYRTSWPSTPWQKVTGWGCLCETQWKDHMPVRGFQCGSLEHMARQRQRKHAKPWRLWSWTGPFNVWELNYCNIWNWLKREGIILIRGPGTGTYSSRMKSDRGNSKSFPVRAPWSPAHSSHQLHPIPVQGIISRPAFQLMSSQEPFFSFFHSFFALLFLPISRHHPTGGLCPLWLVLSFLRTRFSVFVSPI